MIRTSVFCWPGAITVSCGEARRHEELQGSQRPLNQPTTTGEEDGAGGGGQTGGAGGSGGSGGTETQVDQVTVDSASVSPMFSTTSLVNGGTYRIEVRGTISGGWFQADAECRDATGAGEDGGADMDLVVIDAAEVGTPVTVPEGEPVPNRQDVDWGTCQTTPTYNLTVAGNEQPIGFVVNDSVHSDNEGSMTVKVFLGF